MNLVFLPQLYDKCELMLDIFPACSRGISEAEGALLHYPHYNLGWELSHIHQIPCLRQGAHCLNKSNTATQGREVDGLARPDGGGSSPLVLHSH